MSACLLDYQERCGENVNKDVVKDQRIVPEPGTEMTCRTTLQPPLFKVPLKAVIFARSFYGRLNWCWTEIAEILRAVSLHLFIIVPGDLCFSNLKAICS